MKNTLLKSIFISLILIVGVNPTWSSYAFAALASTNCLWKETSIDDIKSDDEVVITMCKGDFTYALPNSKNTKHAPPAVDIRTKVDGKEMTSVADTLKWIVEVNDGKYIFHSSADSSLKLYCNKNDDGVRISSSDNALCNHEFNKVGNYLRNISTSRYLGISFNKIPYSWRSRTDTTNDVINGQSLKLYKRVCMPKLTWDANGGQFTDGSTIIIENHAVGESITPPTDPARAHYTFGGWFDVNGDTAATCMPAENTTYYAKWTCIPINLQVVEWKQNSVSVMYTGAGTKVTTKVGNNAERGIQKLSDAKIDHAIYNLSTEDLTNAVNQTLTINFKDDTDTIIGTSTLIIPAIVATTTATTTALAVKESEAVTTDIVVLDGATLTADTTQYTYNNIVVYPGGSLIIGPDGKLGMNTLTLRAGSSWGADEYENKFPQLLLHGEYVNTSEQINLDYVTTKDYYYPLSVPEEVIIADIHYPVDIYGNNVAADNTGSFKLKYYDGAQRVSQGSQYGTGWAYVDETTTTILSPNQGYAIWGIPKKVSVNNATSERQTYGIHRIPIKIEANTLKTNEVATENITITAHGGATTPPNDVGWNYLGNPYLARLCNMDGSDTDLQMGLLEKDMVDGHWTGGWKYNGERVRYITVTNDCQNFEAIPIAEATIMPFTTFFVQACTTGAIALTAPSAETASASIVAHQYVAEQESTDEIITGILLTGNNQTDRTGLLIADHFTYAYDFNADLAKFENNGINLYTIGSDGKLAFMAINKTLAEQPIPLGYSATTEGIYTFAFDNQRYQVNDIHALYLIDYDRNETTNLLHTSYSFTTAAGNYNQRFALQMTLIPRNATILEITENATIQMAINGNNLMLYNLPTPATITIYDALGRTITNASATHTDMQTILPTGYYIIRIANKQQAVVIDTIIP